MISVWIMPSWAFGVGIALIVVFAIMFGILTGIAVGAADPSGAPVAGFGSFLMVLWLLAMFVGLAVGGQEFTVAPERVVPVIASVKPLAEPKAGRPDRIEKEVVAHGA